VLLYDNKYEKHMCKLQMHWLGPFLIVEIYESGSIKLEKLDGILRPGWMNGTRLKPYLSAA
jgi:hypothetical protein